MKCSIPSFSVLYALSTKSFTLSVGDGPLDILIREYFPQDLSWLLLKDSLLPGHQLNLD